MIPIYLINNSTYSDFFDNPIGAVLQHHIRFFGNWLYIIIMAVLAVDLYIKTQNIATAGGFMLICVMLFTIIFMAVPIVLWAITIAIAIPIALAVYKMFTKRL